MNLNQQQQPVPVISIHVPTRGTTPIAIVIGLSWYISIHVPTRGTTRDDVVSGDEKYFNPRAHEGHDRGCALDDSPDLFQSTCPRGARQLKHTHGDTSLNFNPRAHEGHDLIIHYTVRL